MGRFAVSLGTMLLNEISVAFVDSISDLMANQWIKLQKRDCYHCPWGEGTPLPWEGGLRRGGGISRMSCLL
jgi:hypothetical protein